MADVTPRKEPSGHERHGISLQALKALSDIAGLPGGPLSPLSRVRRPQGPARADELLAAWENLEGEWTWSVPALLDPHCTLVFLCGDGNVNVLGQYVFPDAEAYGPGFEVTVEGERLELTGPLSLGELVVGLHSRLALEEAAEPARFRVELTADHFRALTACLDAHRSLTLGRRLLRIGGAAYAVGLADILEAWADGTSMLNPGWAVSLFQLLAPAAAPVDLAKALPRLLGEMARAGYLREETDTASGQTLYAFAENLEALSWGLVDALHFGLAVRRLGQPQAAEVTVLGGWRTPGGIWMVDLGDMEESGATMAFVGPGLASDLIDDALGDDSLAPTWEEFAMETPYARDAVVSRLRHARDEEAAVTAGGVGAVPTSPSFCTRCGTPLQEDVLFCKKCGAPVRRPPAGESRPGQDTVRQAACPNCGRINAAQANFCRGCGMRLP